MPKLGMEPIRRKALIRATIHVIGKRGSLDVTVSQIAKEAGVSSALAHHYFGSKNKLFLAAMRSILSDYGNEVCLRLRDKIDPRERLNVIVDASFAVEQFEPAVIAAWLNFYVLAQTSTDAYRLLNIYQKRLRSNLRHSLQKLVPESDAIVDSLAALIDGLFLTEALRDAPPDPARAIVLVRSYLDTALAGSMPATK